VSDVVELGRQAPTVESVVSRLDRHVDRIKSITAVVTWDDGTTSVCHETKKTNRIAYEILALQRYAFGLFEDGDEKDR